MICAQSNFKSRRRRTGRPEEMGIRAGRGGCGGDGCRSLAALIDLVPECELSNVAAGCRVGRRVLRYAARVSRVPPPFGGAAFIAGALGELGRATLGETAGLCEQDSLAHARRTQGKRKTTHSLPTRTRSVNSCRSCRSRIVLGW